MNDVIDVETVDSDKAQQLKTQLAAATTSEEIEAIVW